MPRRVLNLPWFAQLHLRTIQAGTWSKGRGSHQALAEVRRLEGLLSAVGHTPLTVLNTHGTLDHPPPEVYRAVQYALDVARQTHTPLRSSSPLAAGDEHLLGRSSNELDGNGIVCTPAVVALPPGHVLDLSSTVAGWTAAEAARLLQGSAVLAVGNSAVVNQAAPWILEIEHPFGGQSGLLELAAGSYGVATAVLLQPAGAPRLMDPRTRQPLVSGLVQVTALCGSILDAQMLSRLAFFGAAALQNPQAFRSPSILLAFDHSGTLLQWDRQTWWAVR